MPPTPIRVSRLPTRRAAVALFALAGAASWAGAGSPLAAQSAAPPIATAAELSIAYSGLNGASSWMGSGAALFGLAPRLTLGGAGTVLLGRRALPGDSHGADQELRVAYGGLLIQWEAARRPGKSVWLRMLAGAGSAKVDLSLAGTQIASDNFGVLVPELGATGRLAGPLSAGAAVGYRFVAGVEDLPGLAPGDLRGPSARVILTLLRR